MIYCSVIFRPPPIDVTTNDTLILHALNSLSEPSTLHHHGMYFNGTTWFDGVQAVSQWQASSSVSCPSTAPDVLLQWNSGRSVVRLRCSNQFIWSVGFTHMHRYATPAVLPPTAWFNDAEQGQHVDGLRAPLAIHPSTEVHSYDVE